MSTPKTGVCIADFAGAIRPREAWDATLCSPPQRECPQSLISRRSFPPATRAVLYAHVNILPNVSYCKSRFLPSWRVKPHLAPAFLPSDVMHHASFLPRISRPAKTRFQPQITFPPKLARKNLRPGILFPCATRRALFRPRIPKPTKTRFRPQITLPFQPARKTSSRLDILFPDKTHRTSFRPRTPKLMKRGFRHGFVPSRQVHKVLPLPPSFLFSPQRACRAPFVIARPCP